MFRKCMSFCSVFLLAVFLFAATTSDVSAQQASVTTVAQHDQSNCTDRKSAIEHLGKAYKEQPIALGLASSGGVIEVLTNEDGSSWSIVVTLPSGVTCFVATGEDWVNYENIDWTQFKPES